MGSHCMRAAALCVVSLLAATACGGSGSTGGAVAHVAGVPISLTAYNHWMNVAEKGQAGTAAWERVGRRVLSSQVMDFLITARWYQDEAAREHVRISQQEFSRAAVVAGSQQSPSRGLTAADIQFRSRVSLTLAKLVALQLKPVTPAEVAAYYRSHRSQFGTPETRDLRVVLTKTAGQATAAKRALSSGQTWQRVALQYSTQGDSRGRGGLLTGIPYGGGEDHQLSKAVFAAKPGRLVGPFRTVFGYYIYTVVNVRKGSQETFAQAKPVIEQTLQARAEAQARMAVANSARRNFLALTSCRPPYAMADCAGYRGH